MNLILLEPGEENLPLPLEDPRSRHIVNILKAGAGDALKAGVVNGPIGRLDILQITEKHIHFSFTPGEPPPRLHPLHLIIGAPRPLVTKRLLKDLSSLGIQSLHFVTAELCEKSYLESTLWKSGEYFHHLKQGAEQSACTLLPEVRLYPHLSGCLSSLPAERTGIVLDPEETVLSLQKASLEVLPLVLGIGPERGWTRNEVRAFEDAGFVRAGLGKRILRTEAACLIASGIVLSRLGSL